MKPSDIPRPVSSTTYNEQPPLLCVRYDRSPTDILHNYTDNTATDNTATSEVGLGLFIASRKINTLMLGYF